MLSVSGKSDIMIQDLNEVYQVCYGMFATSFLIEESGGRKMNRQVDVDVVINGKKYTLSGYEGSEYLQKVANYLNAKYDEFKQQSSYRYMDNDMKNVLMNLNIADDYFKLKDQMKDHESDSNVKSNEIFDLKHEIIALQTKLEAMEKELEKVKNDRYEEEKKNIRLETELSALKATMEMTAVRKKSAKSDTFKFDEE